MIENKIKRLFLFNIRYVIKVYSVIFIHSDKVLVHQC